MATVDLRPLSTGEILDRTFTVYRRYFLLFWGLAGIPRLLIVAAGLIKITFFDRVREFHGRLILASDTTGSIIFNLVLLVLTLVAYLLAQGGTVIAVSELYLGRTTSITGSFKRVWENFGSLFGVVVLNGLATMAGFLLIFVGAIWIGCRLLVCVPAALIEGRGPRESLTRSWELTRDHAVKAFLILLVYIVLSIGILALLGTPVALLLASTHDANTFRLALSLDQVVTFIANACLTPVLLIATAIFYYDLRIRKEGFDLQFMLDPTSERTTRGGGSVPSILG